jgi:hypothetical protein
MNYLQKNSVAAPFGHTFTKHMSIWPHVWNHYDVGDPRNRSQENRQGVFGQKLKVALERKWVKILLSGYDVVWLNICRRAIRKIEILRSTSFKGSCCFQTFVINLSDWSLTLLCSKRT